MSANAVLSDENAGELQVLALPDRAVVSGVRLAQGHGPIFLVIDWPVSTDPATVAAYLKGHTLTVTAKHHSSPSDATSDIPTAASPAPAADSSSPQAQDPSNSAPAAHSSGEKN